MTNEDKKRGQAQKAEKRAAALRENLMRRKSASKAADHRAKTENTDKNKGLDDHDQHRD